jgi:hypothetical protein
VGAELFQADSNTTNLIICGDINIDYLKTSNYKTQLDHLLAPHNLSTALDFPTRTTKNTSTAIDSIFIDKTKNNYYTIEPIINGLSDHDAQVLVLHTITIFNQETPFTRKRQINSDTIAQFKLNLSYESWSDTFTEKDVDSNYKKIFNAYLIIFFHSFPYKKVHTNNNKKAWLMKGIKISCQRKRTFTYYIKILMIPILKSITKTTLKFYLKLLRLLKKGITITYSVILKTK